MKEIYNMKYYTSSLIPKYRHEYITLRLGWLIELFGLKSSHWPMDCMELLVKLEALQLIPFNYGFTELDDKFDAITRYAPEHNVYLTLINKNKVNYPFTCSHDRRLNFTLAHELAHIALGHSLVPNDAKTDEEKKLEEAESDEFAARFLMPEKLIFSCNYYSLSSAAEYFMVSKTALWKRLNNIKRLDLLRSPKIRTCSKCGNTNFSIFSEYCGICGQPLSKGVQGVHRIHYHSEFQTDRLKRAVVCPLCKSKNFKGDRCTRCGTYIFNYCSDYIKNSDACCDYANPSNNRFCEMCGKPTYYYERGLLSSWEVAVDEEQGFSENKI